MKENQLNNDSQELLLTEEEVFSDTLIGDDESPEPQESENELFRKEEGSGTFVPPILDVQQYLETYKQQKITDNIFIPILGNRHASAHLRILYILAFLFFVIAVGLGTYTFIQERNRHTQQMTGSALHINANSLTRNVDMVATGNQSAFGRVKEIYDDISQNIAQLSSMGGKNMAVIQKNLGNPLAPDIATILAQEKTLPPLMDAAKGALVDEYGIQAQINTLKQALIQRNAPANQALAVSRLSMLIDSIENSIIHTVINPKPPAKDVQLTIGNDLKSIDNLINALTRGDNSLGIAPLLPAEQEVLKKFAQLYEPFKAKALLLQENESSLFALKHAHQRVLSGVQEALPHIQALNQQLRISADKTSLMTWVFYATAGLSSLLGLLALAGVIYVSQADAHQMRLRQKIAEEENVRNQAAILRLMDELQTIADGDLTHEATVTEEITGAIADSVNNTVEEWRTLLGNVQNMADKVAQTSADVELTSAILLEASAEQLQAIRDTGQSVLDMAKRINAASYEAKDSALVALRARQAAVDGHRAVQDSIHGMNLIRDQIQDTSKRIKRLGESSQEIGEITELISDITEQTNVLALNAAIQAASAGEAGRGFSVVAEEVQRLAERSAEATQQIAELVKTIQNDTHDAIAAMERSTQEVVQGAALSDNAGKALEEIDRVSSKLSDLIQHISATTSEEANQANTVANSIQQIFSTTEQATEGTRTTDLTIRELTKVAQELRASIARFKIK